MDVKIVGFLAFLIVLAAIGVAHGYRTLKLGVPRAQQQIHKESLLLSMGIPEDSDDEGDFFS